MKIEFFTVFLFLSINGEEIKNMNAPELINFLTNIFEMSRNNVANTDISYYLFTNPTQKESAINELLTEEDRSKPVKILIHGWLENHHTDWYQNLTREYLSKGNYTVIQVDWVPISRISYISSARDTRKVGELVADFVIEQNLPLSSLHIIGHSLGAHVAGFAGKKIQNITGEKVHRITGLDPAGPYFNEPFITPEDRLSDKDAVVVDVIHTDGGFYGYEEPLGTLDIYLNGGRRPQYGCLEKILKENESLTIGELFLNSFCSHTTSTRYFIESIKNRRFNCVKCPTWPQYWFGMCVSADIYRIGAEDINENINGTCYVTANV